MYAWDMCVFWLFLPRLGQCVDVASWAQYEAGNWDWFAVRDMHVISTAEQEEREQRSVYAWDMCVFWLFLPRLGQCVDV